MIRCLPPETIPGLFSYTELVGGLKSCFHMLQQNFTVPSRQSMLSFLNFKIHCKAEQKQTKPLENLHFAELSICFAGCTETTCWCCQNNSRTTQVRVQQVQTSCEEKENPKWEAQTRELLQHDIWRSSWIIQKKFFFNYSYSKISLKLSFLPYS